MYNHVGIVRTSTRWRYLMTYQWSSNAGLCLYFQKNKTNNTRERLSYVTLVSHVRRPSCLSQQIHPDELLEQERNTVEEVTSTKEDYPLGDQGWEKRHYIKHASSVAGFQDDWQDRPGGESREDFRAVGRLKRRRRILCSLKGWKERIRSRAEGTAC